MLKILILFLAVFCFSRICECNENKYVKLMNKATEILRSREMLPSVQLMDQNILSNLKDETLMFGKGTVLSSILAATAETYNVSVECRNQTQMILNNPFELWALRMIDATGKPPPGILSGNTKWLGSFDECIKVPSQFPTAGLIDGKYCYTVVPAGQLTNNQLFKYFLREITLGVCLPDTCSSRDVKQLMSDFFQSMVVDNSTIDIAVECKEKNVEIDTKATLAIVILSILGCMMVVGTVYDVTTVQWAKYQESVKRKRKFTSVELHKDEKTPLIDETPSPQTAESGFWGNLCLAFSVYSNGKKILSTTQGSGALTAVNGIRFLSMSWVILGHTYSFSLQYAENINDAYPDLLGRWTFQAISNALVSVDTFFTLSGLLLSYLVLRELEQKNGKLNWFMFYFHRFWRLTPPYMLVMMVDITLIRYIGNGPLWPQMNGFEKDGCKDTWWKNLLYINNLWSMNDMCMAWSWYLANDMQFFILSPLMIIPLFFFNVIGVLVCFLFLAGAVIATGLISTAHDLPPSSFGGGPTTTSQNDYMNEYYIRPYTRIGPYIVGIFTGYMLYKLKCKATIKWYINIACWVVAAVLACLILYGLRDPLNGDPLSQEMSSFYNAVHRSLWGACVCWVIFACATGNGGFVNTILSWKPFVPLGRLTYCAYLVHPLVMIVYYSSIRKPLYLSDLSMIYLYLGNLVGANVIAFVTSLTFEAPMMGLEKVIFKRGKKS